MDGRQSYLATLLRKAYPMTTDLLVDNQKATRADVIVLCLHCMMVDHGYTPVDMENFKPLPSPYTPPEGWNSFQDEWVVIYARKYSPSRFRLHCAIQAHTGRLFVHASEQEVSPDDGSTSIKPSNIQVLGLQLGNYTACKEEGSVMETGMAWEECLQNERTLREMFHEFVLLPLSSYATQDDAAAAAAEQQQQHTKQDGFTMLSSGGIYTSPGILLASLIGITGITYIGYVYLSSRATKIRQ